MRQYGTKPGQWCPESGQHVRQSVAANRYVFCPTCCRTLKARYALNSVGRVIPAHKILGGAK